MRTGLGLRWRPVRLILDSCSGYVHVLIKCWLIQGALVAASPMRSSGPLRGPPCELLHVFVLSG